MSLIDKLKEFFKPDEFKTFKKEIETAGYELQKTYEASNAYKDRLRFIHVIPDYLWMQKTEETRGIMEIRAEPSENLVDYANRFYRTLEDASKKTTKKFTATHPTFAAGGALVIYCGLKQ